MSPTKITTSTPTLSELKLSWQLSLEAQNKSVRTLEAYLESLKLLNAFLSDQGMPRGIGNIRRDHVEAFIAYLLSGWKPATASVRYRALQQFFKWAVSEGEIKASPMKNMKPPSVPETPVAMLSEDQVKKLLAACQGQDFEERRDAALIMLFLDTGARRAELAGLSTDDLDWSGRILRVIGKGGRIRALPFGSKAGRSLDRYLRVRNRHRDAERPELWLGHAGPMTAGGIYQVLRRRARQAGIEGVHPHVFRHGFAHQWLAAGGGETDLMMLTGWKSRSMLSRYGASAAASRAREAHKRLSPGDRL